MYCNNCGGKLNHQANFCTICGHKFTELIESINLKNNSTMVYPTPPNATWTVWKITKTILVSVIILFILLLKFGISIYNSVENEAIETNNNAISSLDSGNSEIAIQQMRKAVDKSISNTNKLNSLKNIGYIQSTNGNYNEAISSFREALKFTKEKSFDYYLVSAEIASLEGNPITEKANLDKAYIVEPDNFQVNNSLSLFYLDLDNTHPEKTNYPKALEHAQKAYDNDVDKNSTMKENLAIAYYFNNNFKKTIELLSNSDFNKKPMLAYWMGLSYIGIEDKTNAKFYFQKAVDRGVKVPQEVSDFLNS